MNAEEIKEAREICNRASTREVIEWIESEDK